MTLKSMFALGLYLCALPMACNAITIRQGQLTTNISIGTNGGLGQMHGPIGQSFIAPGERLSIGFYFNYAAHDVSLPVQLQILSGDGMAGPELGSLFFQVDYSAADDLVFKFHDIDISSIGLIAGQQYTVVLTTLDERLYLGLNDDFFQSYLGDAYAGGRAYFPTDAGWPEIQPGEGDDFTFRVDLLTSRVPEPGTLALLGLGIAGLGIARRRNAS